MSADCPRCPVPLGDGDRATYGMHAWHVVNKRARR